MLRRSANYSRKVDKSNVATYYCPYLVRVFHCAFLVLHTHVIKMPWVYNKLQQVGDLKREMLQALGNHSASTGEFLDLRNGNKMSKSNNFRLVEFVTLLLRKIHPCFICLHLYSCPCCVVSVSMRSYWTRYKRETLSYRRMRLKYFREMPNSTCCSYN